jgi:hypothetical protein
VQDRPNRVGNGAKQQLSEPPVQDRPNRVGNGAKQQPSEPPVQDRPNRVGNGAKQQLSEPLVSEICYDNPLKLLGPPLLHVNTNASEGGDTAGNGYLQVYRNKRRQHRRHGPPLPSENDNITISSAKQFQEPTSPVAQYDESCSLPSIVGRYHTTSSAPPRIKNVSSERLVLPPPIKRSHDFDDVSVNYKPILSKAQEKQKKR